MSLIRTLRFVQFTGFHGIVIPGTLRDSLFLLEGLLEQITSLRPIEIITDTAGYSDVVFGLFWVLGYQLDISGNIQTPTITI